MKGLPEVFLLLGGIAVVCGMLFAFGKDTGERSKRDEVLAICKTKETMVVETDYATLALTCEVRK